MMTIISIIIAIIILPIVLLYMLIKAIVTNAKNKREKTKDVQYKQLETLVLKEVGFTSWEDIPYYDEYVTVKSRQALENYDDIKFFKENREKLSTAEHIIESKNEKSEILRKFREDNNYKCHPQYNRLTDQVNYVLRNAGAYRICVDYISSAGNHLDRKAIIVTKYTISKFMQDPSLIMGKGEYNKLIKEQQKEALNQKHHEYYGYVNNLIDYANENRDLLVLKGAQDRLDNLITQLFDRTVNSIKKIRDLESEEWEIIGEFIDRIKNDIEGVVQKNRRILEYYESPEFHKIKITSDNLMSSQREFNEYITEKVESISHLFGTRVIRNTTVNDDEYHYIRPYKKTITPFTAEVSSAVFASAENNPLEYICINRSLDTNCTTK